MSEKGYRNRSIDSVIVVGGGTAGWLTAALVAAERRAQGDQRTRVTLIESPDVPTIGVGEGTWPSMRATLQRIGLPESVLLSEADASFKQGTRFLGWAGRPAGDDYLHPFSLPVRYASCNLAQSWLAAGRSDSFASFVSPQAAVIEQGLAPKQPAMPDYAFAVNYAYHLDAGRFATVLREHAVGALQVRHLLANVTAVESAADGDISALMLDSGERVDGHLFVDCTGQRALLLGGHFGVPLQAVDDQLFNDRAIAVQVPHADPDAPVASVTVSTATEQGWIWDIALQSRRGLGHVYSSAYGDAEQALLQLRRYIDSDPALNGTALRDSDFRSLSFKPGYRLKFWERNCVAVGLSAGFVEPLEASAIALIEQAAGAIGRQLPANRAIMDAVARSFNARFRYHWERIVEFLKLHYAISARDDSEYWRAHRDQATWPASLTDKLLLWQQQPPYHFDAPMLDELFPSASYQYVLYGMGFEPCYRTGCGLASGADDALHEARAQRQRLLAGLEPNRAVLQALRGA